MRWSLWDAHTRLRSRVKGFLGVIPILIGIIGGYIFAFLLGHVDFTAVRTASYFAVPPVYLPEVHLGSGYRLSAGCLGYHHREHIGHLIVTNKVVERDFIEDPGLHLSLSGDGIATTRGINRWTAEYLRRKHRSNGDYQSFQRLGDWRSPVIAIILSFIPKTGIHPDDSGAEVMGGIYSVVRNHRAIRRHPNAG